MIPIKGDFSGSIWGYFNFDKIPYLMKNLGIHFDETSFDYLKSKCVISDVGNPIVKDFNTCRTIYDTYDYNTGHMIYNIYFDALHNIIRRINPIEFCITQKKRELTSIVGENSVIYFNRGIIFCKAAENRMRDAFFSYKKIKVEFMLDERFIWSESCYTTSFVGSNTVTGILLVKSIIRDSGYLIFRCTPIALGYGFNQKRHSSPFYETLVEVNRRPIYAYNRHNELKEDSLRALEE